MGGRPRLDQFRPVFPECFSGRENPWKMSTSWFLIEVASPEESGFSLETRCQGTCSRDLPRTSAGCLEPSGQCLRGGLCTEQVFIHFKKHGYGTEQSCSPPLTPTRVRGTQRICFPSWHHYMRGSGPLGETQAVPWLAGWLVELYSWFSVFRDVREPKALADLWNGLCFIPLGISLSKAHCRAKE